MSDSDLAWLFAFLGFGLAGPATLILPLLLLSCYLRCIHSSIGIQPLNARLTKSYGSKDDDLFGSVGSNLSTIPGYGYAYPLEYLYIASYNPLKKGQNTKKLSQHIRKSLITSNRVLRDIQIARS